MSCRHDLANTTCSVCYPDMGGLDSNGRPQIHPGPEESYPPNLDGPGAATPKAEGWGWPSNSKKAHYFRESRAICGKWMFFGPLETGNDASIDNCIACRRKLGQTIAVDPLAKRCPNCGARAGSRCFNGCQNTARSVTT